jgi:hypothetical protein
MRYLLVMVILLSSCSFISIEEGKRRPKVTIHTPWEACKVRTKSKSILFKCKYKF